MLVTLRLRNVSRVRCLRMRCGLGLCSRLCLYLRGKLSLLLSHHSLSPGGVAGWQPWRQELVGG